MSEEERMAAKVEEQTPAHGGEVGRGVVFVNPKPKRGVASMLVDLLEKLAVKLMYDASQPLHYLSGNFAPVYDETPLAHHLPVKGRLPVSCVLFRECLNGELFSVGSNPKFSPVAGYHWFDGDGMVHGLRIKDGKAAYDSRYVKTSPS